MGWKNLIKPSHRQKSDLDKATKFLKERQKNLDERMENIKDEENG